MKARSKHLSLQQALAGVSGLSREHGVDTVIFAMPYTSRKQLARLVSLTASHFRHVLITPDLSGITNSAVMARNLAGTFAVEVNYNLLNPWALRAKRIGRPLHHRGRGNLGASALPPARPVGLSGVGVARVLYVTGEWARVARYSRA